MHHFAVTCLASMRRTRCSSLLWQLPMRDLLGLLRKNPDLYRSACRAAVPGVHFDYLAIVNKARASFMSIRTIRAFSAKLMQGF